MTNAASGEVYFSLYGKAFDPEAVTQCIGVAPTATAGKANPQYTKWQVSTGKLESEQIDVYALSASLVARLAPYASKIVEAKNRFGLEAVLQVVLWISVDDDASTPAIGFEPNTIAFLNTVDASIDVDTYLFTPETVAGPINLPSSFTP